MNGISATVALLLSYSRIALFSPPLLIGILCLQRSSYLLPTSFRKRTYMQARSVARSLRSAVMAPAASLAAARSLTAALSSSTTARPSSDKVGSAAPVFSFDCRDFLLHAGSVFLCALVGL